MRTHAPHNHAGIHLLRDTHVIQKLIKSADPNPGSLVLDLGAGPGTLTAPLADTGARVLAIERNPEFVRRLEKRFAERTNVRVVHQDLRKLSLPHRPFQVVASIPYALSTFLLRCLLGPRNTHCRRQISSWSGGSPAGSLGRIHAISTPRGGQRGSICEYSNGFRPSCSLRHRASTPHT